MKKLYWVATFAVAALIIGAFSISSSSAAPIVTGDAIIYKDLTCGCCGIYGNYAEDKGLNVEIRNSGVDSIKDKEGVPKDLRSCHTMIIDGYFVEGHIPLEAVKKLLTEKPDIAGIAMPGMPSGSPGMPGPKTGDFAIYAVNHDGSYEEFTRI